MRKKNLRQRGVGVHRGLWTAGAIGLRVFLVPRFRFRLYVQSGVGAAAFGEGRTDR